MLLSHFLIREVAHKFESQKEFAAAVGVSRGTLLKGLNKNRWSKLTIEGLNNYFLNNTDLGTAISPEAFEYTLARTRRDPGIEKSRNLWCGLHALEKSKPHQREAALRAAFAGVTGGCNAFLAVVTCGVLPSPFDVSPLRDDLREVMYGAHDRNMMSFFVLPDEKTVSRLKRLFGESEVPSADRFKRGYEFYRRGYVRWCRSKGIADAEAAADERIGMIQYGSFDVTSWRYIACYAGINPGDRYDRVKARIIERGPINDNLITVAPVDPTSEAGMRRYLGWALALTKEQTKDGFRRELKRRAQARR